LNWGAVHPEQPALNEETFPHQSPVFERAVPAQLLTSTAIFPESRSESKPVKESTILLKVINGID
jgi:hypothetical protein